jgi:prevent-host-death family protein
VSRARGSGSHRLRPRRTFRAASPRESLMAKMTITEAEGMLARTIRRVRDERERVTLTENGEPVAAIVTTEDLAFLEELEERIDLEEARKAMAEGGDSIPFEKIRRELGLD